MGGAVALCCVERCLLGGTVGAPLYFTPSLIIIDDLCEHTNPFCNGVHLGAMLEGKRMEASKNKGCNNFPLGGSPAG